MEPENQGYHKVSKGKKTQRTVLGVFEVNRNKLATGVLTIRYAKNGLSVRDFPSRPISPEFKAMIEEMIDRRDLGAQDWSRMPDLDRLEAEEAEEFLFLMSRAGICALPNRKKLTTAKLNEKAEKLQYMLSTMQVGNDNPEIQDEIRALLCSLRRGGRITKAQHEDILLKMEKFLEE